jgi:UTP--glucose-1-phosphate uridylyltransferase
MYLTVFGLYILTPAIFDRLRQDIQECAPDDHEIQLTDALDGLRRMERVLGLVLEGEKIDVGLPSEYLDGLLKYAGRA